MDIVLGHWRRGYISFPFKDCGKSYRASHCQKELLRYRPFYDLIPNEQLERVQQAFLTKRHLAKVWAKPLKTKNNFTFYIFCFFPLILLLSLNSTTILRQ